MKLYPFQEADVVDLLEHDATGVVAAETGAGKTLIGAETARRSGLPTTLIIAPQGTHKDVWKFAFHGGYRWNDDAGENVWVEGIQPDANVRRIDSSATGKEAFAALEWGEPGYYLITPQLFTRWKPEHLRPDLTIVDEAHMLGNREKAGGMLLKRFADSTGHRICMSGTLFRNRFETVWTQLRFLYPDRSGERDIADIASNRWIDTYCATKYSPFAPGNRIVTGELFPGTIANLVPCWRQHFKRRECCEFHPNGFLDDLPEPIIIRETVELTTAQRQMMTQMQMDYLAYLNLATEEWLSLPVLERKKKALVTKVPIVREIRLSQMTLATPSIIPRPAKPGKPADETGQAVDDRGIPLWDVIFAPDADSPKLDKLVEIWRKLQEPVVAATNSQKFAELAVRRLNDMGIRAFEWSGNYSQAQRDDAKAKLIRGDLDIIVGVTAAIGTGIDGLQEASGVLVSLNKSRDLTDETQLEGRLDRRGQIKKDGVIHYEIVAEGSTDEDIIDEQLAKRLQLNRSLRRDVRKLAARAA